MLRRLGLPVLATVLLLTGAAAPGDASASVGGAVAARGVSSPSVTITTTRVTAQVGQRFRLAGVSKGFHPGRAVTVQARSSARAPWRNVGRTRVTQQRRVRWSARIETARTTSYRLCIRPTAGDDARACSGPVRVRGVRPFDKAVRLTGWAAEAPAGDPLYEGIDQSVDHDYGTVTISGTASRYWAKRLPYYLFVEQRINGVWRKSGGETAAQVEEDGSWEYTPGVRATGTTMRLRVAYIDDTGKREGTSRVFTTKSWRNYPLDDFPLVSGSVLHDRFYSYYDNSPNPGIDVSTPTADAATYDIGAGCRTLHSRVGLRPGAASTDRRTASIALDGQTVRSTTPEPSAGGYGSQPGATYDLAGRHLVTITDEPVAGATGDHVWFETYVTCFDPTLAGSGTISAR